MRNAKKKNNLLCAKQSIVVVSYFEGLWFLFLGKSRVEEAKLFGGEVLKYDATIVCIGPVEGNSSVVRGGIGASVIRWVLSR